MTEKVSILLVDDRWENLVSLRAILESPDYDLVKAASGKEALKLLMERDFALILLDVQMPILNGFETAALIKQRERTRSIPIIFVTGVSTDEPFVYKGYGAGAVDYICKPYDPGILRSKVAVFADLYRKNKSLQHASQLLREAEVRRIENASLKRERAANQKYRDLVDGISNGFVWSADSKTLDPIFLSPQISSILGFGPDELLQTTDFWARYLHPDDRDSMLVSLRRAAEEKGEVDREHRMIGRDGSSIWLQTRAKLIVSSDGNRELSGLSVNISRLKTVEVDLHESEERFKFMAGASHALSETLEYRTTLKLIAEVAVPSFADGTFLDILSDDSRLERAAWSHRDPETSKSLGSMSFPPEFYENHPSIQAFASGRPVLAPTVDAAWLRQSRLSAACSSLLLKLGISSLLTAPLTARGTKLGSVMFWRIHGRNPFSAKDLPFAEEISRRFALGLDNARLYKRAKEAVEIRDEFLSTASHELKTPLTPLKIQLQNVARLVAQAGVPAPVGQTLIRSLEMSDRQVSRIDRLIDELLDVSRFNGGELALEIEQVNLSSTVVEVLSRFSEPLRRAGCAVELGTIAEVVGFWDLLRVEQVVVNLLTNAARYAAGKPVHVSLECDGVTATLKVRDHGAGIAREDQERIFRRFERASPGSHGQGQGLGLGLYIVRQILHAHGGEIRVQSDLGFGSTFIVELPLLPRLKDAYHVLEPNLESVIPGLRDAHSRVDQPDVGVSLRKVTP